MTTPDDARPQIRPPVQPRVWAGLGVLSALVLVLVSLYGVFGSGYSGDDIYASQVPMDVRSLGTGTWDYFVEWQRHWIDQNGRFFPGSLGFVVVLFTAVTSLFVYKALQVAVVVAAVGALALFVRQITRNWTTALLAAALMVGAIQIRMPYDGVLQFVLQQPLRVSLLLGSLLAFGRWLRVRRWGWAVATAVAFGLASLMYEASVLVLPCFPFLAMQARVPIRQWWRAVALVTVPAAALVLVSLALRSTTEGVDPGYTTNLAPAKAIPAFTKQWIAGAPLTYRFAGRPPFFDPLADVVTALARRQLVAVAAVVALTWVLVRFPPRVERRARWTLFGVGLVFWVTPAAVVGQTVRWQEELRWGNAYIPVFMEAVGFAMVTVALIAWCLERLTARRLARPALVVVGMLLGFVFHVTVVDNAVVLAEYAPGTLHPRRTFAHAVERGVFADAPAGATVFANWVTWRSRFDLASEVNPPSLGGWVRSSFVEWHGGPRLQWANEPTDARQLPLPIRADLLVPCADAASCQRPPGSFAIDARGDEPGELRYVAVGRLARMDVVGNTQIHFADVARVYVEHDPPGLARTVRFVTAEGRALRPDEQAIVARGSGWSLFRLQPTDGSLRLATLTMPLSAEG